MGARLLDATNWSQSYLNDGAGADGAAMKYHGESNGAQYSGGNWESDYCNAVSTGTDGGARAQQWRVHNAGVGNTSNRRGRSYFVNPMVSAAGTGIVDGGSDGRVHGGVAKVHSTWRISFSAVTSTTSAHFRYNEIICGVYDVANTLIAGIRMQWRGESYSFYLEPYGQTGNYGDCYLGQIRGFGASDTDHAGTDRYATFEIAIDTSLSGTNVRAAARMVLPTGQAQQWVTVSWDASTTSTSAKLCNNWEYGITNARDASGPTAMPYFTFGSAHHVDGTDWWSNYDTNGMGYDGFGHGCKVAYLAASGVLTQDASGWTPATNPHLNIDENPVSYADSVNSGTTAGKKLVLDLESFLTKVGWTGSPYGTIQGVVAKASGTHYEGATTTKYYLGTNAKVGFCDGSYAQYTQSATSGSGRTGTRAQDADNANDANYLKSWREMTFGGSGSNATVVNYNWSNHWGVNEKPGGGAWDPSTIDTDLRLYLEAGPIYNGGVLIYVAGCYVVYREPQRAVASSTGDQGVLSTAPTVARPRANSGAGKACDRIDITDSSVSPTGTAYRWWELPTTDSNGVGSNPVFADYNPATGKHYVCHWDAQVFSNSDPSTAGTGRVPIISEVDPTTGAVSIIWRADEAHSSSLSSVGGPRFGPYTGSYTWITDGSVARTMKPHFLKVDKRKKLTSGTDNPFYGHVFVSFYNGPATAPVNACGGMLWLNPAVKRTSGQYGTPASSDYCAARMLLWPSIGSSSHGSFGLVVTEDYCYQASYQDSGLHSYIRRFDKTAYTSGAKWSGGTAGSGQPVDASGDWSTVVDSTAATMNQLYYLAGKVWSVSAHIFGFVPGVEGTTVSVGPITAGTGVLPYFWPRQLTLNPFNGYLYAIGSWAASGTGNSRTTDMRSSYFAGGMGNDWTSLVEIDPAGPTIRKVWRVPVEIARDAADGDWGDALYQSGIDSHGAHWLDKDTMVMSVLEHRSQDAATYYPCSALMTFRLDTETWHEVTKPALNMWPTMLVEHLVPDRGQFSSGDTNAPPNRKDILTGVQTRDGSNRIVCDGVSSPGKTIDPNLEYRFSWTDSGFEKVRSDAIDYVYAKGGSTVGAASRGHLIDVQVRPPVLEEDEILVTFTVDLTGTGITSIDGWRVEGRSGGTLGGGALLASGGTLTADGSNLVKARAIIGTEAWVAGSSSADLDVFWAVTASGRQYWNSRSTS